MAGNFHILSIHFSSKNWPNHFPVASFDDEVVRKFRADPSLKKQLYTLTATCRGNEPMAALIKEKDTCSNALVDLWCVIDFMEKVGFEKKKDGRRWYESWVWMANMANGQRKFQEGCLEGFICCCSWFFEALLSYWFPTLTKIHKFCCKKVSFPASLDQQNWKRCPSPVFAWSGVLGQRSDWILALTWLLPSPSKTLSRWTKSKNFIINPPRLGANIHRAWALASGCQVNKHGTDVEVLMAKSRLFRGPISSTKFQAGRGCWPNSYVHRKIRACFLFGGGSSRMVKFIWVVCI